jgi:hypothetical protein
MRKRKRKREKKTNEREKKRNKEIKLNSEGGLSWKKNRKNKQIRVDRTPDLPVRNTNTPVREDDRGRHEGEKEEKEDEEEEEEQVEGCSCLWGRGGRGSKNKR